MITAVMMLSLLSCRSSREKNKLENDAAETASARQDGLPKCMEAMIKDQKKDSRDGIMKLYRYKLEGKTVYLTDAPCCDQFSNLYDSACNFLGHPTGGLTGRGDGKITDFGKRATDEKLIWERKQ